MSFLRHSLSTFATQIILMVFGMTTGIITARVLGPQLKGQAVLLTMITQFLYMIGNMGLGSAFSFFIAKKRYGGRQILSAALGGALLLGIVSVICFYASYPLHATVWSGIPSAFIFYATLLAIVSIYTNYLIRIVVGYGRIYSMNIGDLVHSTTNFLGTVILLVVLQYGLGGVLGSIWLATLAQVLVLLVVLRNDIRPIRFWGEGLIREGLSYGIKSHALLLINFLNFRIAMLLLKHFMDDTAVGYYSLAVGMAELMWLVPNATVAPLFSRVAQSEATDRSVITLRTVRWSLIFLIVMALGGILLGRPFIGILYGEKFLPAFLPFLGLLPGICLFPLFKLLTIDLAARGYPGYGTIASAVALATNVAANILLIPRLGIIGAAFATSISYICMAVVSLFFFLKATSYQLKDIFVISIEERAFIAANIQIIWKKTLRLLQ
jgi:Membrane protein involved in the export of O-antigen and teichoic acid